LRIEGFVQGHCGENFALDERTVGQRRLAQYLDQHLAGKQVQEYPGDGDPGQLFPVEPQGERDRLHRGRGDGPAGRVLLLEEVKTLLLPRQRAEFRRRRSHQEKDVVFREDRILEFDGEVRFAGHGEMFIEETELFSERQHPVIDAAGQEGRSEEQQPES